MAKGRGGLIAALDIGTTKVVCFIAEGDGHGRWRVRGIGHQAARGLRAGMIVDMVQAEASILAAVHAAEQMAGETIERVVVALPSTVMSSHLIDLEVEIAGHAVADADIRRIYAEGRRMFLGDDRAVMHALPVDHSIDDAGGIRDPRGMYGERLGVSMHVVTAQSSPWRNLELCIARCHLEIEAVVASPFAAGLACLVEDERNMGTTVVDMGGGTTTMAVFFNGSLIHVDGFGVGGLHVTRDIAQVLETPLVHAERMKTLYGSAIATPSDARELIELPRVGEPDGVQNVPRSLLVNIVRPRVEETLELIRERLEKSGLAEVGAKRVVLTGGASQLQGLRELAGRVLGRQVRLGRPIAASGELEQSGGAGFSVVTGLIAHAVADWGEVGERDAGPDAGRGTFGRLGRWLKSNF
ncbi:MAG: cell division protein FtsA [Tistrella sp.]|jgi:cell division protein FtsA|uniref:Cell division protein FtsA n=2 Tax=Tistrella mobilis TaxID=171437 RepID=I3TVQ8_TISMK|nr:MULTISPECIES: cell division protein FtsA [Tistrella]AFK56846.1 cell division protein FtsA [Tistrella mobilis KA081020-065]KYO55259.1 cell division protein FtsA [Tistrella mobilis]MAD38807.1 cell division protein FtsA [Tistrella sp.]MBA78692.1 cell division protein FtsA [Tistrella sp.]HAE48638.1 cell division protein FtsA [Tistrella mobilis]